MKKKSLNDLSDLKIVFSTNPESIPPEEEPEDPHPGAPLAKQNIRVSLDRKHRAGKEVTIVEGFDLDGSQLEELAKKLKVQCGVGGSVSEDLILLQGDQRKKLPAILQKLGYKKIKVISNS